ncbi:MAG: hypothetical protein OEV66_02100 [Spirochaetia bacterium]|nr:hypothetical protein [Spirochaetia bacterium]
MASNSGIKKISGRRKKTDVPGVHKVPGEVVEIERNIIENWMIALKHWLRINPSTARKIIFGFLLTGIIAFMLMFVHSAMTEKQNSDYYVTLLTYEKLKKDAPDKKLDEKKLKELLSRSVKLCNALWSTRYSNAGCFLSAVFTNELGDSKQTASYLLKFSGKVNSRALAAYAAFYSGYNFESSRDLDQALKLYDKLGSYLDKKTGKDFSLFHRGRIYYYNNKLNEAEKCFKDIIENYKTSGYLGKAKNYLVLVQLKKSAKK